jgi:hypothetical protein
MAPSIYVELAHLPYMYIDVGLARTCFPSPDHVCVEDVICGVADSLDGRPSSGRLDCPGIDDQ